LLARAGVAGVAVYVAIDVVLAFLRPDYSLLHNAESDYGVGPWSWLMDVNFLVRCAATLAIAGAMARGIASSPLLRAALVLIVAWAVASGLLAFFPDDPAGTPATTSGRVHLLIAAGAFLAVAIGTLIAALALRDDRFWRRWAPPLLAISAAAILALLLLGHSRFRVHSDGGLFERIFLLLELGWLLVVAVRLAQSQPSRPGQSARAGHTPAVLTDGLPQDS
jgi:hypothetical membrane protein